MLLFATSHGKSTTGSGIILDSLDENKIRDRELLKNPAKSATYPTSLNSNAKRALYDNLSQDEELTIALDAEIYHIKKDGWRGNIIKEREVKYAIRKHVDDDTEVDRIFELVKNQNEY